MSSRTLVLSLPHACLDSNEYMYSQYVNMILIIFVILIVELRILQVEARRLIKHGLMMNTH
jgi:hypothetical protein